MRITLLGDDFFAAVFYSSEARRKRGKRWRLLIRMGRRSLDEFSSARGEENEASSPCAVTDKDIHKVINVMLMSVMVRFRPLPLDIDLVSLDTRSSDRYHQGQVYRYPIAPVHTTHIG
ncbi:hypothetical protein GW17_00025707 [Ensete ventricosum]|nr:hypothetical protein GW17_00025707 [Ensete ventricosum]